VPTPTPRSDLELAYNATQELERRRRAAPLLFYRLMLVGHAKQRRFHELGETKRRRLFLGGNRSGKTTAGRYEALAHAYGYRFWQVPDLQLGPDGDLPPREAVPSKYWVRRQDGIPVRVPNVGMCCSGLPRQRGIGQNIFPGLYEALPAAVRQKCHVMRGQGSVPDLMDLPNGSRIMFGTDEQDPMTFEGFILDWCWVDEPISQSVYNALWARLIDYQGPVWFTLTPLEVKCAWLYHSLYLTTPDDVGIVEVSQSENPFMTADKIEEFRKGGEYTEQELSARQHGTFQFLGNRVYHLFDPSIHICKAFLPPKDWVHGLVVDPHHRRPAYMVWFAFNPQSKTYHFYREWPAAPVEFHKQRDGGKTPEEYATIIRNAEGAGPKVRVRVADPRFAKAEHLRHGFAETSWVELMAKTGLHFDANIPSMGQLDYGHQRVSALLRYNREFPIGPTNHPKIYVHEGLSNLHTALMNYAFDPAKEGRAPEQKVSETFKDACDALRYAILYPLPATDDEVEGLQRFTAEQLREANEYQ
jgi:terminase large subunit-like protein